LLCAAQCHQEPPSAMGKGPLSTLPTTAKERTCAQVRAWKQANKELVKAQSKRYNLRHKESIAERQKEHRLKNADSIKAAAKEYRLKNAERKKRERKAAVAGGDDVAPRAPPQPSAV
jgi:competence protein ComGC